MHEIMRYATGKLAEYIFRNAILPCNYTYKILMKKEINDGLLGI